jgi:type VI secretion system secreted protein Hcp
VAQPRSATASTAGGHTAERCEHKSISLRKLADLASPILMQTCSAGKTLSKVKLEFMRADSDGKPIRYYEVELDNVIIGSVDQVMHEGTGLHDSFTLKFSKVRWKYMQQKISGGAGGNTAGGWDLSTNRIA